jgi:hypothetical protein
LRALPVMDNKVQPGPQHQRRVLGDGNREDRAEIVEAVRHMAVGPVGQRRLAILPQVQAPVVVIVVIPIVVDEGGL